MDKPIRLPHVTDYRELFDHSSEAERGFGPLVLTEGKHQWTLSHVVTVAGRGDHCVSYRRFFAAPTSLLLETIMAHMLPIDRDIISVEILVGTAGSCLVLARYSQILGSCWLTENLNVMTLPKFLFRSRSEGTSSEVAPGIREFLKEAGEDG